MTVPGTQRYYEDVALFSSDEAVSAFRTWVLREDLVHLENVSTQYRINWAAFKTQVWQAESSPAQFVPTDTIQHTSDDTSGRYWAAAFPVAVHNPEEPVSLDIRIAAMILGGTTSAAVSANIVPHMYPKSRDGLPLRQALWTGSGSTTSTTGAYVIDEQATISAAAAPLYRDAMRLFSTRDFNTTHRAVQLSMFRLELRLTGTYTGDGTANVVAVQVKEYVS